MDEKQMELHTEETEQEKTERIEEAPEDATGEAAPKKKRKKAEKKKEEPIPEIEEVLAKDNGDLPASVITRSGDLVLSAISRTIDRTFVPIVADYGATDAYKRGTEIYVAENEEQAKDMLRLLAQTEAEDRKALGQTADIFYQNGDAYAEVVNSQKKTDKATFRLASLVSAFSVDEPDSLPDSMKELMPSPAAAMKTNETGKTEDADDTKDAGMDARIQGLCAYLEASPKMMAQFLNKTEDEVAQTDAIILKGMVMAQAAITAPDIMDQWYALLPATA